MPAVWVSRWRSVIGRLASRSFGEPSGPKPSNTFGAANSGNSRPTGSSRSSLPTSTSCMAAVAVIAFVMDAIQNTVSTVIGSVSVISRRPKRPLVQSLPVARGYSDDPRHLFRLRRVLEYFVEMLELHGRLPFSVPLGHAVHV